MSAPQLINSLVEFGLSENEAKVYLALLELGPCTTGPLINKTGLYRVIVYDTLNKLLKLGLANYSIKRNRKHFNAEEPKQILELIKNKEILANSILAKLEKLKQEKPLEKCSLIYEGWKGISAAQENYFKEMREGSGGEYLMVGASRKLHERLDAFFNYFHERRAALKVPAKLLFNENNRALGNLKKQYAPVQIRFMPENTVTPSWISTYKDMVLIGVAEDTPMAFFIKNKPIADSYAKYFYLMWRQGKP